ncbi:AB hydrolase superfamily protein B1A11.02 [Pseudocercospora fuligena]|uniref:AB hydrolase superfamily protein B1A11.02 n=1 Tax=Pseudocercospora fuligena TaxID=685502 RepID=A0A8H6RK01_9PEZI|nr:AB hydrolase superfamily protein B1A11.02 [Pseudocercospora fuligena]
MITEADRIRMGTVDPLLAEAVKQSPAPNMEGEFLARRKGRADHLAKLRHLYPIPGPIPEHVQETNHVVVARDRFKIPIIIYKPVQKLSQPSPIVVMLHEGGWSMGDLTDEDLNCRMFARDLGAVCVNVDYRLAPEHAWPKCVEDCYDVISWVAKTASPSNTELPGDPKAGLIVGGASAGGNLAAVMAQLGRDNGLSPPLTGQYLCCASLLWHDVVPEKWQSEYRSRLESFGDPIFGDYIKKDPPDNFAGKGSTNPLFNPLLHPNLKSLPACYQQVSGLDPLRDEALLYDRVLREENGIKTKVDVYDGHGHMFWTNWPTLERSKEFVKDTLEGFKWLLEAGKSG